MAPNVAGKLPPRSLMTPTEAEWRAMSEQAREDFIRQILDTLSDPALTMSEGRQHKKGKTRALDLLGLHFRAMGRRIYLAEEMAVLYPGENAFTPDVLAVVDVEEPEDDPRMAWVVADEGKGIDFVLEVLHKGDRKKDLVDNVERYARLGIPEYFVYDRAEARILGYRLPVAVGAAAAAAGPRRYQRIVPQGGRIASNVLGIDMGIERGTMRIYQGMAELFGTEDLIGRLRGMVEDLEVRVDEAATGAAITTLHEAIVALLLARGIAVGMDGEAFLRLEACRDLDRLRGWLLRAMTAASLDELIAADGPPAAP